MLRVDLRHAKPGMTLALPVTQPQQPSHTLLRVGYQIDNEVIARLRMLGIRFLWVRYPGLEFLEEYVSSDVLNSQGQVFTDISDTFTKLQPQSNARLPYRSYCRTIGTFIQQLVSNPKAGLFLGDLSNLDSGSHELIRHSSAVTYISLLMGLKLEGYLIKERKHIDPGRAMEVTNLGVGAMLHDVGISKLSEEARERYRMTLDDSDPEWREHPYLGYQAVRPFVEPSAATVVLNHHQRFDGSGYAGSSMPVLSGRGIHVFARIVGLAEQFDRMRWQDNPNGHPTVSVLSRLLEPTMLEKFDPEVMSALLAVVPPYPPGSTVRLKDGNWAMCIEHHPMDPCRPTVQIIPDPSDLPPNDFTLGPMIDLSEYSASLHIIESDGQLVGDLNFPRPKFMQQTHMGFTLT